MTTKIPDSAYACYQTTNSLKEETSVSWLQRLLCIEGIKTHFKTEDKNPDIDGTFEILENSRFNGRIEVQIKTYNPTASKNKPKFQCDSKVLYYADKNNLSCVILFVVDVKNERSYWKYLSRNFLDSLNLNNFRQKITINFNVDEYVDKENLHQCISKWQSFYDIKNSALFFDNDNIEESKKNKEDTLNILKNHDFTKLSREQIITIQKFIDRFNSLLDTDYYFIKRFYFPKMWKMGIAVGQFTETALSYALYQIPFGEIDLSIKNVDINTSNFVDFYFPKNFLLASSHNHKNPIIDKTKDLIMDFLNKKIVDVIEKKKFLFLSYEIASEYIYDTLKEKYNSWKIDYATNVDIILLKDFIESKHLSEIHKRELPHYSQGESINTLYHCVDYLQNNGFNEIKRLYPIQPSSKGELYNNYLFEKMQAVFSLLPDLFDAYMYYAFPSLKSNVSFWDKADLLSVNLFVFSNGETTIEVHYFKRTDETQVKPIMIFTKNIEHELYSRYKEGMDIFEIKYPFKGVEYKLTCREFTHSNLNKNYSILNELYKYIGKRFDDYLQPDYRINWMNLGRF